MIRLSALLSACVLPLLGLAQGSFQEQYDWDNGGFPQGGVLHSVQKTSDGFLLGGAAQGSGYGVSLMHTDEAGVPTWNKNYDINGDGFGTGAITTTLPLPDGGFIVAGDAPQLFYARVDADGTMIWAKRIDGTFNFATDLLLTSDGNILFTGKRQGNAYDAFVIKADLDGTVIWSNFYSTATENSEFFTSVVETPDNGFLCLGYRNYNTTYMDLLLVKLDADGAVQWSKLLGSSAVFTWLYSDDIRATADGNFVLTGTSFVALSALNPNNTFDPLMVKVNAEGSVLWSNKLDPVPSTGGMGVTNDHLFNRVLPDGSMMALVNSAGATTRGMQLVHVDAQGVPLGANNLRNAQAYENANDMLLLEDGSLAVTGYNNLGFGPSSSFLMRTDALGLTACNDSATTTSATAFGMPANPGGVTASPCTFTYTDITPATTSETVSVRNSCSDVGISTAVLPQPMLSVQPNPANTEVRFSINGVEGSRATVELIGAHGAVVRTLAVSGTSVVDVQDLPTGFYMVRWTSADGRTAHTKLMVDRP